MFCLEPNLIRYIAGMLDVVSSALARMTCREFAALIAPRPTRLLHWQAAKDGTELLAPLVQYCVGDDEFVCQSHFTSEGRTILANNGYWEDAIPLHTIDGVIPTADIIPYVERMWSLGDIYLPIGWLALPAAVEKFMEHYTVRFTFPYSHQHDYAKFRQTYLDCGATDQFTDMFLRIHTDGEVTNDELDTMIGEFVITGLEHVSLRLFRQAIPILLRYPEFLEELIPALPADKLIELDRVRPFEYDEKTLLLVRSPGAVEAWYDYDMAQDIQNHHRFEPTLAGLAALHARLPPPGLLADWFPRKIWRFSDEISSYRLSIGHNA
jgi:hypothetical protein